MGTKVREAWDADLSVRPLSAADLLPLFPFLLPCVGARPDENPVPVQEVRFT